MADSQLLTIVLIAAAAGVILYRLYYVLGRRTGHERPPQENYQLGPRQAENAVGAAAKVSHISPDRPSDPVTGPGIGPTIHRSHCSPHRTLRLRAFPETRPPVSRRIRQKG